MLNLPHCLLRSCRSLSYSVNKDRIIMSPDVGLYLSDKVCGGVVHGKYPTAKGCSYQWCNVWVFPYWPLVHLWPLGWVSKRCDWSTVFLPGPTRVNKSVSHPADQSPYRTFYERLDAAISSGILAIYHKHPRPLIAIINWLPTVRSHFLSYPW